MSIDHYYTLVEEQWIRIDGEMSTSDFWVDICHGGNLLVDERYYFQDLSSALDFYLDGWKVRGYLDDSGHRCTFDHSGLYSRGRLIHGQSIHGDPPEREGENLCQPCEELARKMHEKE